MSTLVASRPFGANFPTLPSSGYGEDSLKTLLLLREYSDAIQSTPSKLLSSALGEVFSEHRKAGWDGYDASAISFNAYVDASILLSSLPDDIPRPELIPEPSGRIAFEWRKGRSILVASISGRGTVYFAWIHGNIRIHGELPYYDSIPKVIIEHLAQMGL